MDALSGMAKAEGGELISDYVDRASSPRMVQN